MEGGCASEGVVEVLIEPVLPTPLLVIVGESPAARTLARLRAPSAGVSATTASRGRTPSSSRPWATATRISSPRRSTRAPATSGSSPAPSVPPPCSPSCAPAAWTRSVLRVRAPAGSTWARPRRKIAVAILAELVAWRHARRGAASGRGRGRRPVCGMTVAVGPAVVQTVHEGVTVYFCSSTAGRGSRPSRIGTAA